MKALTRTIPGIAAILAVIALAYAAVYWSLLDQQIEVVTPSWYAGARLVAGCLILTFIGHAVCRLASKLRVGCAAPHLTPLARSIVALVVGQSVCMAWVLLRAGCSGVAYAATGYQLPITRIEIVLVLVGLVISAYRAESQTRAARNALSHRVWWSNAVAFVGLIALSVIPVALRELPRDIALSSDPDQYAFWTSQVLRLGGVPWDQGILGIGSFGYPAGFAVLGAIWCVVSGLSPVEIVTIQPMLQFILAALFCAALAEHCLNCRGVLKSFTATLHTALASCLLLTAYWTILPYGYQQMMYHSESTARASTSLLMAVVLGSLIMLSGSPRGRVERRTLLMSLGASGALIATINPITALVPCCLIGVMFVYELGRTVWMFPDHSRVTVGILSLIAICFFGVLLILSDPYFSEMIISVLTPPASKEAHTASLALQFTLPEESIFTWLRPTRMSAIVVGGAFPPDFFTAQFYLLLSGLYLWWLVKAPGSALRFAVILVYLSLSFYLSLTIPRTGDVNRPLYLVQPYIMQSIMQAGPVLGLLLLATGSMWIARSWGGWGSLAALAVGILAVTTPDESLATYSRFLNTKPRRTYCGSLGSVSVGDRAALAFVTELGNDILSKYSSLSYDEIPKIMIPTHPADLGTEEWLFPFGASRLVPLVSPLPVAFFYSRGSPQWTFANYRRYVCSRFDVDWLKRRNVRFLFLPSQNPGCIRGKSRVIESSTILFERDGAKVLKLF